MDLNKVYYDSEGNAKTILQMVKSEPEWAANRLQEGENAIEKANGVNAVLGEGWRDARKELPEHDNDVLVYCDGCGGKDYYSLGKYIGGQWVDKFDTCVLDAIGWMELPDPPAFA